MSVNTGCSSRRRTGSCYLVVVTLLDLRRGMLLSGTEGIGWGVDQLGIEPFLVVGIVALILVRLDQDNLSSL